MVLTEHEAEEVLTPTKTGNRHKKDNISQGLTPHLVSSLCPLPKTHLPRLQGSSKITPAPEDKAPAHFGVGILYLTHNNII